MFVEMLLFMVVAITALGVSYYNNWRHVFALIVSAVFLAGLFLIESLLPYKGLFGGIFILLALGNFAYLIFIAYISYATKSLSELFSDLLFAAVRGSFALTIVAVGMTFALSTMIYIFWPSSWGKIGELSFSAAWVGVKICGISIIFSVVLSITYFIIEMIFETKPRVYKTTAPATTARYHENFPVSRSDFPPKNNRESTSQHKENTTRTYDYTSHKKEGYSYNSTTYQQTTRNNPSLANRYQDFKPQPPQQITPAKLISQKFIQFDNFCKSPIVVVIVAILFLYDVSNWSIFKIVSFGNSNRGESYSHALQDDFQKSIKNENRYLKNSLTSIANIITSKQIPSYTGYHDAIFVVRENRCKAAVSLAIAGLCSERNTSIKESLLHAVAILTAQPQLLGYVSKNDIDTLAKQWLESKGPVKYEEMTPQQIFTTVRIFAKVNDVRVSVGKEAVYSYIFETSSTRIKKRRRASKRRYSTQRIEKSIEPFLWKSLEDRETFIFALACLVLYHKQHSLYLDDIVSDVQRPSIQRLAALMIYWHIYKVTDVATIIDILNKSQTQHLRHLALLFLGVSSDEQAISTVSEYISHRDEHIRLGAAYASLQHQSSENLARYLREKKYDYQDRIFLNSLNKMNPDIAEQVVVEKLRKAITTKSKTQTRILYSLLKTMVKHKVQKHKVQKHKVQKEVRGKRRKHTTGDIYENAMMLLKEWQATKTQDK